ncbi:Hint domain-containing protein [Acidocella sp.]|uniref:Hint domain-containing protein n=1 Tax=Acidocella sp. TaxID=50710 RepID=UPI00263185BB|nr:Hint domain-containing protein [Acidocella sp.]
MKCYFLINGVRNSNYWWRAAPVKISAGCWGHNLPKRDLSISPGHSMLVGGVLVLARLLVNGITITQDGCPERVDYFQLEFDTHDCVLAEGVWSESYADGPGLRGAFHNAAEFFALYPDYPEPLTLSLCASRPLEGPGLEAVLRPLLAGIATRPGALDGCIDEVSSAGLIRGWAWDAANPHFPVLLEMIAGNLLIGTVLACDYRHDLRQAGLGRGHCSFSFTAAPSLLRAGPLTIRRVQDQAEIHPPTRHGLIQNAAG